MPDQPSFPLLITGGRGVLAGAIARRFRAQGAAVETYSRRGGDGHRELGELFTDGSALRRGGTLLHLAWSTLPFSAEQPGSDGGEADLQLLDRLLDAVGQAPEDRRPHFVFFSSGGTVYGNAVDGRPCRESDPCRPIGRHGRAKAAAERRIAERRSAGLAAAVLRISNPYGYPVPSGRPQGIIPIALDCARRGHPLTLWGDGTARKDFLHFEDFATALAAALAHRLEGTYNVSYGESHTLLELLTAIERATGTRVEARSAPAHPWDVHDSVLDNTLFRTATGWRPRIGIDEGIRRVASEGGT